MVLVTGAGGQVGKHLLKALSAKRISTRAWIHRKRNEEAVVEAGATEVYVGDLLSDEDMMEAMKGIDTVYYICNAANPNEDEIGLRLINIAKREGNITFIYHSVMHALLCDIPHHKRKQSVEKNLVDSGLPYVILQPAVFVQMLAPGIQSVKSGGPFFQKFYTSDHTKMSFVDINDYAESAAEIIARGSFVYGTYELCSEGAYSLYDLEQTLSELTGHRVTSAFISDANFLETAHMDGNSYAGQTLLAMFRHYNHQGFCGNAFTMTQILGRKPVTVKEYFQELLKSE